MSDPLAQYHDKLNATVVEALGKVAAEMGGLRADMANQAAQAKSYQNVTMQHSARIVALEKRADDIEHAAGRRRTDARAYLWVQGLIGGALALAILFVGLALWRIAAFVEVLAR